MTETPIKQDSFHPIIKKKISHSNLSRGEFIHDIESIKPNHDTVLIEDKEDLNEISSLLAIIPKSTNGESRETSNSDISTSQEILRILRYSKMNRHNSCLNVKGYMKTISLTGRVIQSDSNLLRLTGPFDGQIPERVQNPFMKNFLEGEDC